MADSKITLARFVDRVLVQSANVFVTKSNSSPADVGQPRFTRRLDWIESVGKYHVARLDLPPTRDSESRRIVDGSCAARRLGLSVPGNKRFDHASRPAQDKRGTASGAIGTSRVTFARPSTTCVVKLRTLVLAISALRVNAS
jgi:hypothetical protein